MSIILTAGQAGDNPQLLPLLDQLTVGRDGPGRPRKRPDRILAQGVPANLQQHPRSSPSPAPTHAQDPQTSRRITNRAA
jgi:hypothetical protein